MSSCPRPADDSLEHDGSGEVPAIQYPWGGWDTRPHAQRVVTVDLAVLSAWARLFDDPGTPAEQARLLRPLTQLDLAALATLADQPTRLSDYDYQWTAGWHEKGAKADGTTVRRTEVPSSWDEVILQGPHFTVANQFAKQPNENCRNNKDWTAWDLERLPATVVPRTNYQRACDPETYTARLDRWSGEPYTIYFRLAHRLMSQPGLERSLHAALIPPGPTHIHSIQTIGFGEHRDTVVWAGLAGSLPHDYIVKVGGLANLTDTFLSRFPLPAQHPLDQSLILRTLRLNCLTADYAPLWEELFDPSWRDDAWTDPTHLPAGSARPRLGDVGPAWSMATPLRTDADRRKALVELDALAAIMLGLTAEQLCAMYRTQFSVLRKYEYFMLFDAQGRKIAKHHQAHGHHQQKATTN